MESRDLDLDAASAVSDSYRIGCFVPPEFSVAAGLMALPRLLARATFRARAERGPSRLPARGPAGHPAIDQETLL